jgi:peptidoglycan/LPS O-acetylase OafA/YrhL
MWLVLGYLFSRTIFLGLGFFTLVNACARREQQGRWPAAGLAGAITRVGLWSYSLYLVHFPVQTIALAASRRVVPEVGVILFVVRAFLLTAVSCVAARLFFQLVERHFVTLPRAILAGDEPVA